MPRRTLALHEALRTEAPPPGFLDGSVYKDILYHGTRTAQPTGFSLRPDFGSEYGIYVSPSFRIARDYGDRVLKVFVRLLNPLYVRGKYEISPRDLTPADIQRLERQGFDGIVVTMGGLEDAFEVVLFHSEQVWVFGDNRYSEGLPVLVVPSPRRGR